MSVLLKIWLVWYKTFNLGSIEPSGKLSTRAVNILSWRKCFGTGIIPRQVSKTVHPTPPKFAENIFQIFVTPKYYFPKIFSPPNGIGHFWAQFQVTMKIQKLNKLKKMLTLKFWYLAVPAPNSVKKIPNNTFSM